MLLLIDNYDSFVYNLARYLQRLGAETIVVRNDEVSIEWIRRNPIEAIVLSPGPCTPQEAGMSLEIVQAFADHLPLLGVCLGHQTIAAAFGAKIVRANTPMHGRTSRIHWQPGSLFEGLNNPVEVARYHSLVVDEASLPAELRITARTSDDTIMAFEHESLPIVGWQFHPESILTDGGYSMLAAFFRRAGIPMSSTIPDMASEQRRKKMIPEVTPNRPITF